MKNRDFADKDLRCVWCGDGFVFSAGEQELLRLRGITTLPDHCPNCVRSRHRAIPNAVSADRSTA